MMIVVTAVMVNNLSRLSRCSTEFDAVPLSAIVLLTRPVYLRLINRAMAGLDGPNRRQVRYEGVVVSGRYV